jgi:hypothetical protein
MRFIFFLTIFISITHSSGAQNFEFVSTTSKVSIVYGANDKKLDSILAHLLANDIEAVTNVRPIVTDNIEKVNGSVIIIGSCNSLLIQSLKDSYFGQLEGKWECFSHKVIKPPFKNISQALVIAGSDARGTAYGVFTLSEKIGVSPWYWWADVRPKKRKQLTLSINPFTSAPPAVKFRGIFINDEDWGLQPWAAKTFESETGDIGPKTYAKVFELLLRLKANLIWPAMHESTKAFFHYPGNPRVAEDYQIVISSSHAEPMLRNNVGEWDVDKRGRFNYLNNKEAILKYWEERVIESQGINAMYSLGIRGVHDSQMEGVKDLKEAVPIVEKAIKDQRDLLAKYINKDVTTVPQVLTPYKEVLEIYNNGLKVPEDVILVWPDDNYGYIARLNNEKEKARKGGAGVYYHASYWGRPHDYLWLSSTHPGLIREEMVKAYETGADDLWVLNVGDIKPMEYNMQLFLDMAYNPVPFKDSRYTKQHLHNWLTSIFGKGETQRKLHPILWEYYQLAFERKPEFMGWSQTEPTTQTKYSEYNHFYYGDEAQKRIDRYNALEIEVKRLRPRINSEDADAFYQLVYYPVVGASWMVKKFLYRDKAYFYSKQNRISASDYAQRSKAAHDSIFKETDYFNDQLEGGKWKHIMSMKPRNLPVFQEPVSPDVSIIKTDSWGVAPEGYITKDSSLLKDNDSLSLPGFDNFNKQRYFIDIFLCKSPQTVTWTAFASHSWIRLSIKKGLLRSEINNNEMRIWVDIDWSKIRSNGKMLGIITISAGGRNKVINVKVSKDHKPELAGFRGFVENNGFVVLQAPHFTRQTKKQTNHWRVLSDLGYKGSSLQAFPLSISGNVVTHPDSIKLNNAGVEYDFYTFSSANPVVTVFALPTHPINNNFSVRYAVSIDDGPVKVVDIKTFGRSEEWKQNVLSNRAKREIEMPFLNAGMHTLRIYCVDPGVILDEVRINLGGLKKAYSTIAETKIAR